MTRDHEKVDPMLQLHVVHDSKLIYLIQEHAKYPDFLLLNCAYTSIYLRKFSKK